MKVHLLTITTLVFGLSAIFATEPLKNKVKLEFKTIYQIAGQQILEEFIGSTQLTVVYYYKKDLPRLKFFFKELDKSAEYLELYRVKVAVIDCKAKENTDVKICELDKVEQNVYTYRAGRLLEIMGIDRLFDTNSIMSNMMLNGIQLLSLEFDTMFDVNSIMSNILQLVLLRQVPIVQTPKEVGGLLNKMIGKTDVIFGHVKAIGTFDHRVFMEVAYAYQEKFKFALCTDEQAITAFSELPTEDAQSNIYVVFTKDIQVDEEVTGFHSIKYSADLTLPAFAKFLQLLSLPKMYNFPNDGTEDPFASVDAPHVQLYYDAASAKLVSETAALISNYYWGTLTLTVIDMDETVSQETFPLQGKLPAVSIQMAESTLQFMNKPFDTENIASFLEEAVQNRMKKMSEEERQKDYASPVPPEIHDDAPYIDHEALDIQDDEVADAVYKNKEPMPLNLVPALTDKTFPTTIQSAKTVLVYFYFPFDAINTAFLRKYGEAADRLGNNTKLSITRVNCYDWTDVCSLNNITVYPTLRVFEDGEKSWDYRGPKDTQELYSTFRLLELSPPVYETDPASIRAYIEGNKDSDVKSYASVVVVGLFSKDNKKEMEVFIEVAKISRDRILFLYSDIEDTNVIATQFNTKVPAIIMSKYDDTVQPYVVYTGQYETDALRSFIHDNKLPKLTTLTPLVFPELYKRGRDFLILFTDDSPASQDHENMMREVLHAGLYNNLSFTLMPVPDEKSVGYKVLQQYAQEPAVPLISYVDFKMGEVFNYAALVYEKQNLIDWITAVTQRVVKPSSVLKDNEWQPVERGYDFLKIIDWEKAQEKKKKKKSSSDEAASLDREENEYEAPIEDSEDAETRQELFELHNSRLYAKAGHSKHPEKKEEADRKQKTDRSAQMETRGEPDKKLEQNSNSQKQEQKKTSQKHKPVETSPEPATTGQKEGKSKEAQKKEEADRKEKDKSKHTEL